MSLTRNSVKKVFTFEYSKGIDYTLSLDLPLVHQKFRTWELKCTSNVSTFPSSITHGQLNFDNITDAKNFELLFAKRDFESILTALNKLALICYQEKVNALGEFLNLVAGRLGFEKETKQNNTPTTLTNHVYAPITLATAYQPDVIATLAIEFSQQVKTARQWEIVIDSKDQRFPSTTVNGELHFATNKDAHNLGYYLSRRDFNSSLSEIEKLRTVSGNDPVQLNQVTQLIKLARDNYAKAQTATKTKTDPWPNFFSYRKVTPEAPPIPARPPRPGQGQS